MADPDLCPNRRIKEILLPSFRKCTAFQTRLLEVRCRRCYSWELPLAVLTDGDTKHKDAEAPLQKDESLVSSTNETIAHTNDKGQDTPGFQLHQTHKITEFPIPQGTWINGRWKPSKPLKEEQQHLRSDSCGHDFQGKHCSG